MIFLALKVKKNIIRSIWFHCKFDEFESFAPWEREPEIKSMVFVLVLIAIEFPPESPLATKTNGKKRTKSSKIWNRSKTALHFWWFFASITFSQIYFLCCRSNVVRRRSRKSHKNKMSQTFVQLWRMHNFQDDIFAVRFSFLLPRNVASRKSWLFSFSVAGFLYYVECLKFERI